MCDWSYIDKMTLGSLTLWLPAMRSHDQAEALKGWICERLKGRTYPEIVFPILGINGFTFSLVVEYNGPISYRVWTMSVRPDTMASRVLDDIREGKYHVAR